MLGISLIIASNWSVGRIQVIFKDAMFGNGAQAASLVPNLVADPHELWSNLKIVLLQILFIWIITVSARAIPALANMWLIVLIGLWILWIMKNPEILKLLQAESKVK